MKRTIDHKTYNTETGQFICNSPRGELYKRYHSIDYFLFDRYRNKSITPITWEEAKSIAYNHAPSDLYNRLFIPRMNQGRTNIDLPLEHYDKLKICAALHNNSVKKELQKIIDKEYRNRDRHKHL